MKKGNKDPIRFLYDKWESLGLTEEERDEKIAYICNIRWESPIEYIFEHHKSLGIEDKEILSSIVFELGELRYRTGEAPIICKSTPEATQEKNDIMENMYLNVRRFESEFTK